jgi:hypothetical protein
MLPLCLPLYLRLDSDRTQLSGKGIGSGNSPACDNVTFSKEALSERKFGNTLVLKELQFSETAK